MVTPVEPVPSAEASASPPPVGSPPGASSPLPPIPPPPSATSEGPYSSPYVLGAVVLTVFAPFISLIAALVIRGEEKNPERRQQLSSWAVLSGIWLAIGGIILIAALSSMGGVGSAGCKGGIDHMIPPSYTSSDGQHWTAQYVCVNGGTLTRPAHAAWLNQ